MKRIKNIYFYLIMIAISCLLLNLFIWWPTSKEQLFPDDSYYIKHIYNEKYGLYSNFDSNYVLVSLSPTKYKFEYIENKGYLISNDDLYFTEIDGELRISAYTGEDNQYWILSRINNSNKYSIKNKFTNDYISLYLDSTTWQATLSIISLYDNEYCRFSLKK